MQVTSELPLVILKIVFLNLNYSSKFITPHFILICDALESPLATY